MSSVLISVLFVLPSFVLCRHVYVYTPSGAATKAPLPVYSILWDNVQTFTGPPPGPTRPPGMPKITGKITVESCDLPQYRHLRCCNSALNPSRSFNRIKKKTMEYLCKEQQLRQQRIARPDKDYSTSVQRRLAPSAVSHNPCAKSAFPHAVEIIEAEDMNGNIVELYTDLSSNLFQTFYKRECDFTPVFRGLRCQEIKMVVETAIYVDDGDGDPWNDPVEIRKIQIPLDCALHNI